MPGVIPAKAAIVDTVERLDLSFPRIVGAKNDELAQARQLLLGEKR